jgi:hypothetical protein
MRENPVAEYAERHRKQKSAEKAASDLVEFERVHTPAPPRLFQELGKCADVAAMQ